MSNMPHFLANLCFIGTALHLVGACGNLLRVNGPGLISEQYHCCRIAVHNGRVTQDEVHGPLRRQTPNIHRRHIAQQDQLFKALYQLITRAR